MIDLRLIAITVQTTNMLSGPAPEYGLHADAYTGDRVVRILARPTGDAEYPPPLHYNSHPPLT